MVGVHLGRIPGGLEKPVRGSLEFPCGRVMNGQVGRNPRGIVLVEVGEAIGNQPAPFRSTCRRHCRVEGLLVEHMDERVALTRKGIYWIAFPEERDE